MEEMHKLRLNFVGIDRLILGISCPLLLEADVVQLCGAVVQIH